MNAERGVIRKQPSPKELWSVCILLPITCVNIINWNAYRNGVILKERNFREAVGFTN